MNHLSLRIIAIILLASGTVSFLAAIKAINISTISDNDTLKLLSISSGLPTILATVTSLLRPELINRHKQLWYMAICVILFIIPSFVLLISWYDTSGFDMNNGCGAVRAWEDGFDPYIAKYMEMYSGYPYSYGTPPISLLGVKLVCLFNYRIAYYTLWSICLIASFVIIRKMDKQPDPFLLIVLLFSGFTTVFWNYWTGNVGIPQLLLFSLAIVFILNQKYYPAAFVLGITMSLKIWPLAFTALLLFAPKPIVYRFRLIAIVIAAFGLVHLISYLIFPEFTVSYYQTVAGTIQSQHSPIKEALEGSLANPAPVLWLKTISRLIFGNSIPPLVILEISYVLFILLTFFHYVSKRGQDFPQVLCLGILSILLIMPRLPSYSFVFALLPVYALIKSYQLKHKLFALLIVSVVPMITLLSCMMATFHSTDSGIFWQEGGIMADDQNLSLVSRLTCYGQGISLLAFYVYYLIRDRSFGFLYHFSHNKLTNMKNSRFFGRENRNI